MSDNICSLHHIIHAYLGINTLEEGRLFDKLKPTSNCSFCKVLHNIVLEILGLAAGEELWTPYSSAARARRQKVDPNTMSFEFSL